MIKILHSADLHLDAPFSGRTAEQADFLRRELLMVPGKLADLCLAQQCDLVLLAGDLFDGAYSKESYRALYAALERMGVPVFVTPGNHDHCGMDSPWEREVWPENVCVFTKERIESVALPELNCRVYGAGYQGMDCPGLLAGFATEGTEKYHISLLHADPTQPVTPYCPMTKEQVRQSGLDYLALGHVHKSGEFQAGETLCAWPGCPMGRGYDETGEKGALIVTLDETATVKFVPMNTPRFYDLQSDERNWKSLLPPAGSNDFYRITLTGYRTGEKASVPAGFANLELRDDTMPESDLWGNAGDDTLEGIYFGMLRDAMEAGDETQQRRIRLAAEISRQILDGQEVKLP